jgi:serine protease Do
MGVHIRELEKMFRFGLWLALAMLLTACASTTRIVKNEKLSKEVKSREISAYKEIILIPPAKDPRELMPRVAKELGGMGYKVNVVKPGQPLEAAQGTGFLINSDGYLLTCAHVIGESAAATIILNGKRLYADVASKSTEEDLAILKLREAVPEGALPLEFRPLGRYSMGEEVYTIGYPLSRLLGENARMSRGMIAATTGLRDDPKTLQVSAEVQPGNSGGPLLDREGRVIGMIQKTINPWRVVQSTGGALPQNVNFSIKNESVLKFVGDSALNLKISQNAKQGRGLDKVGLGVAKVISGIVSADEDRRSKMVVRVAYASFWDLWHRFRYFVLTVSDFDSGEPLFAVGQGRDNPISNEDIVIRDTLAKFKEAVSRR